MFPHSLLPHTGYFKMVFKAKKEERELGYLITFSSSLALLSEDWKDCFQMLLICCESWTTLEVSFAILLLVVLTRFVVVLLLSQMLSRLRSTLTVVKVDTFH